MGYPDDGELVLEIAGARVSGWQSIRVSRGVERCPSDFEIAVTEEFPGSSTDISIEPGQVCVVKINSDVILTGYVDRCETTIVADSHTVRVSGLSACEDIVDCMVTDEVGAMNLTKITQLAQLLCAPYGVKVKPPEGNVPVIPQFVANLDETVYSAIKRHARYSGILVYDDVDGALVLAQLGAMTHASGFSQGLNVLEASVTFGMDQRYTEYDAYLMTVNPLHGLLPQGGAADGDDVATVPDPGMANLVRPDGKPRVRRLSIISEQNIGSQSYAALRARWEMSRRFGQSQAVRLVADSWRDKGGTLWTPNWLVSVDLPMLKVPLATMVIGEVSYVRDDNGTRAELLLMPPQAYQPEPTILNPFDAQLAQATVQNLTGDGRRDRDSYADVVLRNGRRDQG